MLQPIKYYVQNKKTGEIKVTWANNPVGARWQVAGSKKRSLEWVAVPEHKLKINEWKW